MSSAITCPHCGVRPLDPNTGDGFCPTCTQYCNCEDCLREERIADEMARLDLLTLEEIAAEQRGIAEEETLNDRSCTCDDVDVCPNCARELARTRCRCGNCPSCNADYEEYLAQQAVLLAAGKADETAAVTLSPEMQALFNQLTDEDDLPF